MHRTILALTILAALALPGRLAAQMIELDGGARIGLTGRLQVQYNTSSLARNGEAAAGEIPFSTFETRRARLGVRLEFSDWIGSEVEAEFASRDVTLKYAFVNLGFDPRFAVRIGQFKKPFSLLELTSSTKILPIERGLRIRGLSNELLPEEQELLASLGYSSYDLGVELHGRFGRFGYQAGAFNGNGGNGQAEPGGHAFVGRLTLDPLPGRPLTFGAAASHLGSGSAFEVDAEWGAFRRPGLHVMAEAALGDNLVDDGTFSGAQVIAAVFKPLNNARIEGIEPLFRVSYGNSSRDYKGDEGWLLTPGINLYFAGRNRLMVNWEFFMPGSDSFKTANALRAQAQIHF